MYFNVAKVDVVREGVKVSLLRGVNDSGGEYGCVSFAVGSARDLFVDVEGK